MPRSPRRTKRRFAVRTSSIHGRGVFALRPIARGERLIEYTGERMSHDEADERYGEEHEDSPHTMLFAANDEVVIDATNRGSSARWINHSCAPNCEAVEEDGRVFIDARRAIRPGEELTYDYQLIWEGRISMRTRKAHACGCGTEKCRGTMLMESNP